MSTSRKKSKSLEKENIQIEIDAAFLYKNLAVQEKDPILASVFYQMSEIEMGHAQEFCKAEGLSYEALNKISWRAKTLNRIGKVFGYDYVLGALLDTEKNLAQSVLLQKKASNINISGTETNHVKILRNILENEVNVNGTHVARLEKRHRTVGGNAIRAAVLGGNDGLVSNFSLVMGVAGASAQQENVVLAGSAGLLAGALSMALGEWISVKSSQELYENQMQLELEELELNPEGEKKELKLIYMSKGIPEDQAEKMAAEIILDKDKAHQVLIREELGIQPEELKGSAMEAAISSFVLFAIGAVIPVFPFFFLNGWIAIASSAAASAIGLFLIGAAITLFTGKNVWFSGFRQVFFGLSAAAITFGIGKLIGFSVT
jgi:VIT1/CCC1 family predicted Fe2+/Mn2+ transporter